MQGYSQINSWIVNERVLCDLEHILSLHLISEQYFRGQNQYETFVHCHTFSKYYLLQFE